MKIKKTAEGRAARLIALFAGVYEEERSAVLSVGCDGFVRKLFREHEIFGDTARHLMKIADSFRENQKNRRRMHWKPFQLYRFSENRFHKAGGRR